MYHTLDVKLNLECSAYFSLSDNGNISVQLADDGDHYSEIIEFDIDELLEQEIGWKTVYDVEGKVFPKQEDKNEVLLKYLLFARKVNKAVNKYANKVERMKLKTHDEN